MRQPIPRWPDRGSRGREVGRAAVLLVVVVLLLPPDHQEGLVIILEIFLLEILSQLKYSLLTYESISKLKNQYAHLLTYMIYYLHRYIYCIYTYIYNE